MELIDDEALIVLLSCWNDFWLCYRIRSRCQDIPGLLWSDPNLPSQSYLTLSDFMSPVMQTCWTAVCICPIFSHFCAVTHAVPSLGYPFLCMSMSVWVSSGCYKEITKYHALGSLSNRHHLLLTAQRLGSPWARGQQVQVLVGALFLSGRQLAAFVLCPHIREGGSSGRVLFLYEALIRALIWYESPTLMTSFKASYLPKAHIGG